MQVDCIALRHVHQDHALLDIAMRNSLNKTRYKFKTNNFTNTVPQCNCMAAFASELMGRLEKVLDDRLRSIEARVSSMQNRLEGNPGGTSAEGSADEFRNTASAFADIRSALRAANVLADKDLFTVAEVSKVLASLGKKCSEYTLRNVWCANGLIPCNKVGSRYQIPLKGLMKAIEIAKDARTPM